jgi:hypothetical protein
MKDLGHDGLFLMVKEIILFSLNKISFLFI